MTEMNPEVHRDPTNPDQPQSPAAAVLDTAAPVDPEAGEGRVHEMTARHARLAMADALADCRRHLARAADPRPIVRQHPWTSVGIAAGVGFVAAALAVPSEKQRAASRLRAIERALSAEGRASGVPLAKKPGWGRRLFRLAWRYGKPTIVSALTSAATGAAAGAATAEATEDAAATT